MGNLGPLELGLIAAVVILLFGAKKLPEMARSLGKAKGEFKKGLDEGETTSGAKAEALTAEQAKLEAARLEVAKLEAQVQAAKAEPGAETGKNAE